MSTLNSVVGNHFTRWKAEELDSDDALAQFHGKFWGVSMNEGANDLEENGENDGEQHDAGANEEEEEGEEEEGEEDDEADEEEEEEEEDGDGDGNDAEDLDEEEEEEGEEEEADEDDAEDEGDFIDGCRTLDINIDDIETSIWIRAEYIRVYNHIATLYREVVAKDRKDKKSSCVILTGQPGIGEFYC
jgi:hypothetical protein